MKSSDTDRILLTGVPSASGTQVSVTVSNVRHKAARKAARKKRQRFESAIYSHIRAMRALGRTRLNTAEIAEALSLSIDEVNRAVSSLKKKGVRSLHA